ncbi:MAG: MAG4270 family putative restriction endonuclease [Mycoplasmoidaceae bacterium]
MGIIKMKIQGGGKNTGNFLANLKLLYDDDFGYLIDFKIDFINGTMDTLTTKSWFNTKKSNNKIFILRKEIFDLINFPEQQERLGKSEHNLRTLNEEQLKKLSKYFSKEYNSTIYNIVTMFKGSNPSGSYKNSDASQLWENDTGKEYNLNIFCTKFMEKKNSRISKLWNDSLNNENKLEYYLELFPIIHDIFIKLQNNNNNNTIMKELKKISDSLMKKINKAKLDIKNELRHYSRNIGNEYKDITNAYYKIFSNQPYGSSKLERAHILPKWYIIKKMQENFDYENQYKYWLKKVSDPHNFLPLETHIHKHFDSCPANFFWNEFGKLIEKDKNLCKEFEKYLEKCNKISDIELKNRSFFLKEYVEKKIYERNRYYKF